MPIVLLQLVKILRIKLLHNKNLLFTLIRRDLLILKNTIKDLQLKRNVNYNIYIRNTFYAFPGTIDKNSYSRSFRIKWLNKYNCLECSHLSTRAFCKVCILLGKKRRYWRTEARSFERHSVN